MTTKYLVLSGTQISETEWASKAKFIVGIPGMEQSLARKGQVEVIPPGLDPYVVTYPDEGGAIIILAPSRPVARQYVTTMFGGDFLNLYKMKSGEEVYYEGIEVAGQNSSRRRTRRNTSSRR